MLDPRSLAKRRDEIVESCRRRRVTADVDGAIRAQEKLAAAQTELGEANRQRNEHQAAGQRKLDGGAREAHTTEGRRLKSEIAGLEAEVAEAARALDDALSPIPNLVHPETPAGGEADFREIRRVGTPRRFTFEPLDHVALGEKLALIDFEAGAKVTGQKFYFLKNEAVLLDLALQRLAFEIVMRAGYTPFATPDLARQSIVDGLAFSPRGAETQIYTIAGTELDLIGTAEITLGGLHADEILEEASLPLRLAGVSHCFRTEAGAAGRESRGLYRVHQFTKVEMFVLARPEDSEALHAEILGLEEEIFQALETPYRIIDVAAGDLGAPAYRKFDLEAWLPGRGDGGDWGEVTSCSNCTDYQARRLQIRFKREAGKRNELVHTLNGTAIAISRALIALLENHQQEDGSIAIPKPLRPHLGLDRIGPR
jgi:seryl-tRNA synthetase